MNNNETEQQPDLRGTAAAVASRTESAMRDDLAAALAGCDPLLDEILRYCLLNGGKRIRPLLTVLAARSCGRDDDTLYLLATAFEYLHVATLVHDDVIDRAEYRRGKETVVARFGTTAAILAGDWLHARSMHLIGRLTGPQGLEIFCRATASMVNGEFAQLRCSGDASTREEQYFAVIRQKTGNLIACACALGALFAGADQARQQALTTYGDRIGAAFQVVDDLLDYQGEAQQTGKQTGNDFVEGKITLPLLHTLDRATASDRQTIAALLEGDRQRPEAYALLVTLINRYDGFNSAAQTARELIDSAVDALALFATEQEEPPSIALLKELARYIVARNT